MYSLPSLCCCPSEMSDKSCSFAAVLARSDSKQGAQDTWLWWFIESVCGMGMGWCSSVCDPMLQRSCPRAL